MSPRRRSPAANVAAPVPGSPTPPGCSDRASSIPPEWAPAIEPAAAAAVTMVVGESESGKTTLITALANALLARGFTVAIVDADLGQSEIGPPTTIGLGRVTGPLGRERDAELIGFHFVGATSPARSRAAAIAGTHMMVERARGGFQRVLVDTSGLIAGGFGRALKQAKIDRVAPDLLICLERKDECGPLAGHYASAPRPAVLRLPALANPRRRSPEDRRRHRAQAMDAYFGPARPIALDLARIQVLASTRRADEPFSAAPDTVVGLLDAGGETIGLGLLVTCDTAKGTITIVTPVGADRVASVMIGEATYER